MDKGLDRVRPQNLRDFSFSRMMPYSPSTPCSKLTMIKSRGLKNRNGVKLRWKEEEKHLDSPAVGIAPPPFFSFFTADGAVHPRGFAASAIRIFVTPISRPEILGKSAPTKSLANIAKPQTTEHLTTERRCYDGKRPRATPFATEGSAHIKMI